SGAWTRAGKALTFTGGAVGIAAPVSRVPAALHPTLPNLLNLPSQFILLGRWCLGSFLVSGGIQHFMFAKFVASLIPIWFPGNAMFWTYFAAVALLFGGIGFFLPRSDPVAGFLLR